MDSLQVDATTLEDDDAVDELLKISYLVRADDDRLLFAEVTSYGAAEFSLRRNIQPVRRLIEEKDIGLTK